MPEHSPCLPIPSLLPALLTKSLLWLFSKETNTNQVSARSVPALPHITGRLSRAGGSSSHSWSRGGRPQQEGAAGLEVPEDKRVEPRRSLSSPEPCKGKETAWGEGCG